MLYWGLTFYPMSKLQLSALPLLAACAADETIEAHHNLSAELCLNQAKTSANVGYIMREEPELINDINELGCIDVRLGAAAEFQNADFIYEYRDEYAYPEVYDYPTDEGRETLVRICNLPTQYIKAGQQVFLSATVENCRESVSIGECVGSDDFICEGGFDKTWNPLPLHEYVYWED